MGGRGSAGGTQSTYRGDSTAKFKEQMGMSLFPGGGGSGGGGGGGSSSSGTATAGTGGSQTAGGGNGGGSGTGAGAVTTPVDNTTVDSQVLPPDADLEQVWLNSQDYQDLLDKIKDPDAFDRAERRAYARWLAANGTTAPSSEVTPPSPSPSPAPAADLSVNFGSGVSPATKRVKLAQTLKMPKAIREVLADRGLKINVSPRADRHPNWAEYAEATGTEADDVIGDGRSVGNLSFYDPNTQDIFISTSKPGSSKNVMVHEMAHGVDDLWLETPVDVIYDFNGEDLIYEVKTISREDPYWIEIHRDWILPNENINSYYRGGPEGDVDEDGRSEFFAEGMAVFMEDGRDGLLEFVEAIESPEGRDYVVDTMIAVWEKYGII